jgi:cyanophycin synthetase
VKGKTVILAEGAHEEPLLNLDRVPMTFNGRISFEVENTIAVLGAAWAMGISRETIIRQASCFATDASKVPGRFNVMKVWGATVVVDYGHNADSLRAMVTALDTFPHKKRSALYSMAGDRRDIDLINMGELLGNAFDRVILYEAHTIRGRAPGRIAELMREGLARGKRVKEVEEIEGAIASMEFALNTVQPEELLLLQADTIDESVNFVRDYIARVHSTPVAPPKVHSWNLGLVKSNVPASTHRSSPSRQDARQEVRRIAARTEMCFGMQGVAPRGAKAW